MSAPQVSVTHPASTPVKTIDTTTHIHHSDVIAHVDSIDRTIHTHTETPISTTHPTVNGYQNGHVNNINGQVIDHSKALVKTIDHNATLHPPPVYHALLSLRANNMVIIGGTVRASMVQKVEIKVKVHGKADQLHVLTGQGLVNAYLTTANHGSSIVLPPVNEPSVVEFTFYYKQKQGDFVLSKLKQDCFKPGEQFDRPKIIQVFYFRTEDWTDNDWNDTVLAVTVLPDREGK